jgi:prevent-host-death family protein
MGVIVADLRRWPQLCLCTRVDTDAAPGRRLGVRELRASLAESVRRAASGERTVVTASGRPVAQLAPLDAIAPTLDGLLASGALVAPRRTSEWRAPAPVRVWAGVRIDQVLRELRG